MPVIELSITVLDHLRFGVHVQEDSLPQHRARHCQSSGEAAELVERESTCIPKTSGRVGVNLDFTGYVAVHGASTAAAIFAT